MKNRMIKKMAAALLALSLATSAVATGTSSFEVYATDAETTEEGNEAEEESPEVTESGETTEESSDEAETGEGAEAGEGESAEESTEEAGEEEATEVVDQSQYPTPTEWPAMSEIDTPSAILIDADTGAILYSKDPDAQYYPASITKILTALVVLENAQLDDIVTFSEKAVYENEGNTSHIARDVGEQMTIEQTLYGMMLESANECAWALAEHVGGGDAAVFVEMMNAKAEELGCTGSHFANPNGLHDDNHYTTASDMAKISQAAWENADFRRITGTRNYSIPPTNKHDTDTILNNHHQMLNYYKTNDYLYSATVGGKTGFTSEARYTLVTYCEQDGKTLISVVMHTEYPTEYLDTTAIMDYGFDNFYNTTTETAEDTFISASAAAMNRLNAKGVTIGEGSATLPNGLSLTDCDTETEIIDTEEVEKNEDGNYALATLHFSWQGHEVGSVALVSASKPTATVTESDETEDAADTDAESEGLSTTQKVLIAVAVVIGALVLLYIILYIRKLRRKKLREERAKQRRLEEIRRRREQEELEQQNRRRNTRYRRRSDSTSTNRQDTGDRTSRQNTDDRTSRRRTTSERDSSDRNNRRPRR